MVGVGLRLVVQFVLAAFGFAFLVELVNSEGQNTVDIAGHQLSAGALLFGFVIAVVAIVLTGIALPDRRNSALASRTVIRSRCTRCDWTATSTNADEARELGQRHYVEAHDSPTQPT